MVHQFRVIVGFWLVLTVMAWCAKGDGGFISKKGSMLTEPLQRAIIFNKDGVQDLALQVKYSGDAKDFCWIVPVPATPKVQAISGEVFDELSYHTQRRIEMTNLLDRDRYGYGAMGGSMGGSMGGGEGHMRGVVEVVDRSKVGVFDTAVIKGKDSVEIQKWLLENGYDYPESRKDALEFYTRKGWMFVAMRIDPLELKTLENKHYEGNLAPVMFTYESKEIVYPLYISSLNEGVTSLVVHVVGETPVSHPWCMIEGLSEAYRDNVNLAEQWNGKTYYRRVKENELVICRGVFARMNKEKWFVTRLECVMNPEMMTDDLVFKPAGGKEEAREIDAYLSRLRILAHFRLADEETASLMERREGVWVREWDKTHREVYMRTLYFYEPRPGSSPRDVRIYYINPREIKSQTIQSLNEKEKKALLVSLVSLHRQVAAEQEKYGGREPIFKYCDDTSNRMMVLVCRLLERVAPEFKDWESHEQSWREIEEIVLANRDTKQE